jgi:RND family efflux transporter MFP subunit
VSDSDRPAPRTRWLFAGTGAVVTLVAGLGIATRVRDRSALRDRTLEAAAPIVSVIAPSRAGAARDIVLPGNVEAFTDAPIYARTSGYLKAWYVDIGARVAKGQKLADIEAPEVDQELEQARAQLGTARANEELARLTADRYSKLVETDAVSRQDYDNAVGAYAARQADTLSAAANVRKLERIVAFERIEAPFAGTITARNTDVGQLVDAGSSGGPSRELFRIASTEVLRVFVDVPQTQSSAATIGTKVNVTFAEKPSRIFQGPIVRTSNAIDPVTRTLRVEVDLDNARGEMLPGAYGQVHLKGDAGSSTLLIPATAVLFRAEGLRAATVDANNHVTLVPIVLGRDFGTQVEVLSGLDPQSRVIDGPPDSILDGQSVRIAARPAAETKAAPEKHR